MYTLVVKNDLGKSQIHLQCQ